MVEMTRHGGVFVYPDPPAPPVAVPPPPARPPRDVAPTIPLRPIPAESQRTRVEQPTRL